MLFSADRALALLTLTAVLTNNLRTASCRLQSLYATCCAGSCLLFAFKVVAVIQLTLLA